MAQSLTRIRALRSLANLLALALLAACVRPEPARIDRSAMWEVAPPAISDPANLISAIQPFAASPTHQAGPRERPTPPQTARVAKADEVDVIGESYSGYWVLSGPSMIDVDLSIVSGITISFDPEGQDRNICLIHDVQGALTAKCIAGDDLSGQGSGRDGHIRLTWWAGPGTLIFEGDARDGRMIQGTLSGGVIGLRVTGRLPAILRKLDADGLAAPPDSLTAMRALMQDIATRTMAVARYGGKAVGRFADRARASPAFPPEQEPRFLGQITNRWRKGQREAREDVYRIATPDGAVLCRLALDPPATITDFECRRVAL